MAQGDHRSNSVAIAELALEQIRQRNQSAEPPSYEIWYQYAAGHNPELNRSIDGILARNGRLSEFDLDAIRLRYLRTSDVADRLGKIGQKINDEVEQVVGMIEAAVDGAVGFDKSLIETNRGLAHPIDRQTLRNIIEAVVIATKEMQDENGRLGITLNESRQHIAQLQENLLSVRMESLTDPLTAVANRRYFDECLRTAITESELKSSPLSLVLADIDNFKKFNDHHGHQIGDQVLRLIAGTMKNNVKGQDFVARYGGEEFAIVLPNTALREAITVADNIRRAVATNNIIKQSNGETLGRLTISMGVASFRAGMTAQSLIEAADTCLYTAKKNGRNCVMCETDLEAGTSSGS